MESYGKWCRSHKRTNLGRFSCQLKRNEIETMIIFWRISGKWSGLCHGNLWKVMESRGISKAWKSTNPESDSLKGVTHHKWSHLWRYIKLYLQIMNRIIVYQSRKMPKRGTSQLQLEKIIIIKNRRITIEKFEKFRLTFLNWHLWQSCWDSHLQS